MAKNKDLDRLYGAPIITDPLLAIGQENKGTLEAINGVSNLVTDVIENYGDLVEINEFDSDRLATERLDILTIDLAMAGVEYENITGLEYPVIEEGIIAIEAGGLDMVFPSVTPDDIDIFVLFPMIHEYNKEGQIVFFKGLITRLKVMSPSDQAYILFFNELINKKYSKYSPVDIKHAEEQQKQYERSLEKVFSLQECIGIINQKLENCTDSDVNKKLRKDLILAILEIKQIAGFDFFAFPESIKDVEDFGLDVAFISATSHNIYGTKLFPIIHEYNKKKQIVFFNRILRKFKASNNKPFKMQRLQIASLLSQYIVHGANHIPELFDRKIKAVMFYKRLLEKLKAGKIKLTLHEEKIIESSVIALIDEENLQKLYEDMLDRVFKLSPRELNTVYQDIEKLSGVALYDYLIKKFGNISPNSLPEILPYQIIPVKIVSSPDNVLSSNNPPEQQINSQTEDIADLDTGVTEIVDSASVLTGKGTEKSQLDLEEKRISEQIKILEKNLEGEFEGKNIVNIDNVLLMPNGDLAGKAMIGNIWYPFNGDNVITQIGGEIVTGCSNLFVLPNGDLAGKIGVGDKWQIFSGDKVIKKIGGRTVIECNKVSLQTDGIMIGVVLVKNRWYEFSGDKWYNFSGDSLLEEVSSLSDTSRHYAHLNVKGVAIGRETSKEGIWYPSVGGEAIKEIGGIGVKSCYYVHSNPITGEVSGEMTGIDDKRYLFVGDRLISTIGGKKFTRCINIHTQPNGTLAGAIRSGGKFYLFVGDMLIPEVGGKVIEECYNIHTQPNGTLAGRMKIDGGKERPFVGNEIIYKIGGQDIEDCDNIHTLSNGLLAGDVWLQGKKLSFIGDEII